MYVQVFLHIPTQHTVKPTLQIRRKAAPVSKNMVPEYKVGEEGRDGGLSCLFKTVQRN